MRPCLLWLQHPNSIFGCGIWQDKYEKEKGKDPKSNEPSEKMNSYMSLGKEEAKFREVSWGQKRLAHSINLDRPEKPRLEIQSDSQTQANSRGSGDSRELCL